MVHFINKIYSDLSRALFLFLNIIIIILIRIHIFIIAMLFPHREGSRSYQLLHIVPAWCKQRGQDPLSPCNFSPLGASGVDTRTSVTIANIIVCIIITIFILRFLIIDIITTYHRDDWLLTAEKSNKSLSRVTPSVHNSRRTSTQILPTCTRKFSMLHVHSDHSI